MFCLIDWFIKKRRRDELNEKTMEEMYPPGSVVKHNREEGMVFCKTEECKYWLDNACRNQIGITVGCTCFEPTGKKKKQYACHTKECGHLSNGICCWSGVAVIKDGKCCSFNPVEKNVRGNNMSTSCQMNDCTYNVKQKCNGALPTINSHQLCVNYTERKEEKSKITYKYLFSRREIESLLHGDLISIFLSEDGEEQSFYCEIKVNPGDVVELKYKIK